MRHLAHAAVWIALGPLALGGAGCASAPADPGAGSGDPGGLNGPRTVQPGAPGTPSRNLTRAEATHRPELPHTAADVRFMQNMIHHHAQALVLAAMVPERTDREDFRLLASRIARSQTDEIRLMQNWLEARGEHAPEVHEEGHDPGGRGAQGRMAGMLTPAELEELAALRGTAFERRFLEAMIFHHDGALTMVEELFSAPGAAQGSETFQFASHVDADQRIEIARMYRMLAEYR